MTCLCCGGITLDYVGNKLGGLRELKLIFLLISILVLMKAITQRESFVNYITMLYNVITMFNIPNTQVHAH